MSAFPANSTPLDGIFDWITGGKSQTDKIADGIYQIPFRARSISASRAALLRYKSVPSLNQAKVQEGLRQCDYAEAQLRALDAQARQAWRAAYQAGKVENEYPPETEIGMSGVFAWAAIGIAGAAVVAAFVVTAPFTATMALVVGALATIAAIVDLLGDDNARAQANRKPGDPPVPSIISSGAGTAAGLSLLPLLALGGIGVWFLTRRRSR